MTAVGPDVPVRSAEDLRARWASLLGGLSPGPRALWLTWVHADGSSPALVVPYDDLPGRLDAMTAANVLDLAAMVAEECGSGTHAALALHRRGRPDPREDEAEWAATLRRLAPRRCPALNWSLHLVAAGAVTDLVPPPW